MRRGGVLPRPLAFCSLFASEGVLLSFPVDGGSSAPRRGSLLAIPYFASGGLFSFNSERKEEKKRRQKLRFWISLRAFTRCLSCSLFPRERYAAQISPKYCIVSASRSAAASALKCRSERFYASVCRGGVLPRPKHCEKSTGGAEPLPYGRFYEGADENRLSLRQNRRF